MKKLALCLFGVVLASNAMAAGCDWATDTPADDSKYKYFVARVYSEEGVSDAQAKAEQEINNQICRLFGADTVTSSEFYSDTSSAQATSRTQERCVGVRLEDFTKVKTGDEHKGREYVACVEYKYAISAYNKEKNRIKSGQQLSVKFSEVSGNTECRGAPVEIVTTPANANVTLTNNKYTLVYTTPVKIANVCNGVYDLDISLPNYDSVHEKLVVPTSSRISKTLHKKAKKVTVRTNLGGARICVNGGKCGKEPLEFSATLGDKQSIKVTHSETLSKTEEKIFSESTNPEWIVDLSKKPATIDFTAFKQHNSGVRIFVDGVELKFDSQEVTADERHSLLFTKGDYKSHSDSIRLKGGETKSYSGKALKWQEKHTLLQNNSDYWAWLGASYTYGNYSNDLLKDLPAQMIGLDLVIFPFKWLSLDFGADFGLSNLDIKSEKGFNISHSTASNLFPNNNGYLNFTMSQYYMQLRAGTSIYFVRSKVFSPFISVGYGQFFSLSNKISKYSSNVADAQELGTASEINTGGIYGGAGIHFLHIFRLTGTVGPNYYGATLGIGIPL